MGSTDGGVNTSPLCDSGVLSPSQTGYARKEFLMMPPEGKLKHFDSRAQAHEDNQEVGAITNLHYFFMKVWTDVFSLLSADFADANANCSQSLPLTPF